VLRSVAQDLNAVKMKPAYHHGSLRVALIEAAAHLAAQRGPSGVTLRETARRAGVTQAAPYHYFSSKSALIAAVAEDGFRALDDLQTSALERCAPEPLARVAALVSAYVRFAIERPHYFKVMFRDAATPGPVAARVVARLTDAVRSARTQAGHDDLDPAAMATLMWAVPHGLASLYVESPLARRALTPIVLEGLARAAIEPLIALRDVETGSEWAV
jgi:AcrR family transcriptional regulator